MKRQVSASYYVLIAISAMAMAGIFALLGELRNKLGFSESQLGFMVAMGFFAGFIAQVGLSRFSDRGHANAMIRGGHVLMISGLLLMSFVSDLWWFTFARILLGIGVGMFVPAVRRLVIVADPANLGANVGRLAVFDVGGFVVGPLIAGLLAEFFGLRAPFLVLATTLIIFLPVAFRLPPDLGAASTERRVVRTLLENRGMQAVLAAVVGWFVMIGTFEAVWAVLLSDLGADVWLIGVSSSLITLPMIFLAQRCGTLAHRVGPLRLILLGLAIVTPCVVAYGFIDSIPVLIAVAMIHGVGDALVFPSTQVGVALAAGEDLAASAQGLQGATLQLVAGLVALVAGAIYENWGREIVYVANGVILVLGMIAAWWLARPLVQTQEPLVAGTR